MTDQSAATSPFGLLPEVRDGIACDAASRVPRLLVSVRNADEARAAIAGGCDILDVKEPNHGSLGLASLSDIESINREATKQAVPCSVALGEAAHWLADCVAEEFHADAAPDIRPDFLKLGLACLGALPNWAGNPQSSESKILYCVSDVVTPVGSQSSMRIGNEHVLRTGNRLTPRTQIKCSMPPSTSPMRLVIDSREFSLTHTPNRPERCWTRCRSPNSATSRIARGNPAGSWPSPVDSMQVFWSQFANCSLMSLRFARRPVEVLIARQRLMSIGLPSFGRSCSVCSCREPARVSSSEDREPR